MIMIKFKVHKGNKIEKHTVWVHTSQIIISEDKNNKFVYINGTFFDKKLVIDEEGFDELLDAIDYKFCKPKTSLLETEYEIDVWY